MSEKIIKIFKVLVLLYIFLLSIALMGSSFKFFGKGFAQNLIATTSHPIIALFIGILATGIIQSSSTTTSMIVALVSAGVLTVENAVPMVMGANIGTTVTNTMVSFAQITRKDEFVRGFAAGIVHDFFNIIMVALFLPLELLTGFLHKSATFIASLIAGTSNIAFHSPVKAVIKPVSKTIIKFLHSLFQSYPVVAGIILLILSLIMLFFALWGLVKTMKTLMMNRTEIAFNNVISKTPLIGIIVGTVFTAIVQSSSITTSIMVPMAGAGLVTLETVFPITLGANIGTTFTALLASLAGNRFGLTIALVHFLFNFLGVLIVYPFKSLREIPINLAQWFSKIVTNNRKFAILYVLIVFFFIPGAIILISKIL